jgi:hypothetical protein
VHTSARNGRGGATRVHPTADQERTLCLSIVCAIDGARFAAVAATEQQCLAQVASYIAKQARGQLRAPIARRVQEHLAAGDVDTAVAEYFRHAGERWEAEWLVTTFLSPDAPSMSWSGPVPLPKRLEGRAPLTWSTGKFG